MVKKIMFTCKGCSAVLYLTMEKVGKKMRCPHCNYLMHISDPGAGSESQSSGQADRGTDVPPSASKPAKKVTISIVKSITPANKELPPATVAVEDEIARPKKDRQKNKIAPILTTQEMPKQRRRRHETQSLPIQKRDGNQPRTSPPATSASKAQTSLPAKSTGEAQTSSSAKSTSNDTRPLPIQRRRSNETQPLPLQKRRNNDTRPLPIQRRRSNETQPLPLQKRRKNDTQPLPLQKRRSKETQSLLIQRRRSRETAKNATPEPVTRASKKKKRRESITTIQMPQQRRVHRDTKALPIQKTHRPEEQALEPPVRTPVVEKIVDPALIATPSKYDPERGQLYSRNKWYWWQLTIKWSAVVAVVVLLIVVERIYHRQSEKPVQQLFQEYVNEDSPRFILWMNQTLISSKIRENDLPFLLASRKETSVRGRILIAECLEMLENVKAFEVLAGYLKSDSSSLVRQAAAQALATIRQKRCIDLLIECLSIEINRDVQGSIARSLRYLTGETGKSFNADYWKHWWRENRDEFEFRSGRH